MSSWPLPTDPMDKAGFSGPTPTADLPAGRRWFGADRLWLVVLPALILGLVHVGCDGGSSDESAFMVAGDPDGSASVVEEILFGTERCGTGRQCRSGFCSMGMCIGYLAGSSERVRGRIAPSLAKAAGDPALSVELVTTLIAVLQDPGSDPFHRARAADALRHVRCDGCVGYLAGVLDDPQEPVRFFAARSLHYLGAARGTAALQSFRDHRSEAVRTLVAMALDRLKE